ncbi:MAG: fibronectin type III domain-containing protein, partial [Flammeovirgaceae bacterium]|nr:fibronectin type III domain-containing protein [Flammeovirgaceae bacterium]
MKIIVPILNRFVSIKLSGILFIFLLLSSWGINAQQASNITFTGVTTTTLSFNWTDGTVGNRIVVIKDAAGTFTPAVNTTYTANLNFTSGTDLDAGAGIVKCVFNGTSGPITVSDLSIGTVYTVQIYNYTGSAGAEVYNVTTATDNPNNRTTLAALPGAQPTAINFSAITGTSMDVNWTAASGSPSGYLVIQRSGAAPTGTPTSGQGYTVGTVIDDGTVAFVGNAVTFNNTSLTVGTTYHYAIFSYNGNAASTNYRT